MGKLRQQFKLLGVENTHILFSAITIFAHSAETTPGFWQCRRPPPIIHKSNGADIRVGFFDLQGASDFIAVDHTQTWCWQMGCRLQWYPGDPDRLIMYNAMVNGQYGSIVQDIRYKKVEWRYASPFLYHRSMGTARAFGEFFQAAAIAPGIWVRQSAGCFTRPAGPGR
jgi:hypothetical protein